MNEGLGRRAGSALAWKAVELVAARGIALLRTLILARLLAPDDFGLLAIAAVAVEVMVAVTEFGMIPALVQRKQTERQHYDAAWTVGVLRAAGLALVIVVAAPLIADLFGEPRATNVLRLLALRPLLDALSSIRVADLTRQLRFRPLAGISVPASLTEAVVAIALAPVFGVWALVAGALSGATVALVGSYVVAPHRPRFSLDFSAARPLFRYGRWVFLTGVVGVVGGAVLQAAVSRRLGAPELGVYFVSMRLAFLPNEVVSTIVVAVAFSLHARVQEDAVRGARAFRASLTGMLAVLAPAYAVLAVLAPSLVDVVLGPGWEQAVPVLQVLLIVGVIGVIADATMPMLEGRGRPYNVTLLYAIRSIAVVALVWGLADRYGVVGAALAWLAAEVAVQATCVVLARRLIDRPFAGLAAPLSGVAAAAAAGAAAAWGVDRVLDGFVGLGAAGAAGLAAAGVVGLALDRWLGISAITDVARLFPRLAARLGRG